MLSFYIIDVFIEFTENLLYHDMYPNLDMQWPILGYKIKIINIYGMDIYCSNTWLKVNAAAVGESVAKMEQLQ